MEHPTRTGSEATPRRAGTPGSSGAVALRAGALLAGLLFGVAPLHAQVRTGELRAAAQRLRQTGAALDPLPDTGITRDVGEIAVVEHDGSSYDDRLPDGSLNYEARLRVGRRFYETHGDDYDLLVVFTNFAFRTGDAQAFHLNARNDVDGIGLPLGNIDAAPFGSPARLKGWIDMAAVSSYRAQPFSLEPGDPGFQQTLAVLAHEMGHQWLAYAHYKADGVDHGDLLGKDEAHWSYLLDSDASFLYGAEWHDNGDGTFTAARVKRRYSALDLYLMGLLPGDKVGPVTLLRNPAVDRHRINQEGEVVAADGKATILVPQLVDAMGPRKPDFLHSQKEFRLGFVFLTRPGTEPAPEDLEAVDRVRRAFGALFFAATNGVGWADTDLTTPEQAPRAPVPDLPRALEWLAARQSLDGSWADSLETRVRETASAVTALVRARAAMPAAQRGIAWLQAVAPESLDFQARAAIALEPSLLGVADRASRVARLLDGQNPDGGFGAGRDFASDALDTALALRALKALGRPADDRVQRAVRALAGLVTTDGGWPAVDGGETSTVVTAEVLLALLDWSDAPASTTLQAQGLAALLARRNPDGGFGSSPRAAHASALALEVLLRSGGTSALVDPLTAWLQQAQLADGSWASSPYQTALVVGVLSQALGANLVVPAGSLVATPNPAREGDLVRVVARVRNTGRVPAPATVARLYDADPGSSASRGEAAVPALAPGEETGVAFDYPTTDRPGSRTLYVVADAAGEVAESREDDNTASLSLTVEGLLPDLAVEGAGIVVAPAGPQVGDSVTVLVTVWNRGARSSPRTWLAVGVEDPAGREFSQPFAATPALGPGETTTVAVPWTPAMAGPHAVRVQVDPAYAVPESDETNNSAARTVLVVDTVPSGPELAVGAASVDDLTELPQTLEVRAVVENAGRTDATTSVAVFDRFQSGPVLGRLDVAVGARSASPVRIPVQITTPGSRGLVVVVDPDDLVPETDETNNTASVVLRDAGTNDLEVSAVSAAPAEGEVGKTLTVSVAVRNRGTLDAAQVPVQLLRSGSLEELGRTVVTVAAGQSTTVSIPWTPAAAEDPLTLLLRVDPFDVLRETREDNNTGELTTRVRPASLPNLTVSGAELTVTPDPPVEGQAAKVSAVVRNIGGVSTGPFSVRLFVGDPDFEGRLIGEASVPDLGAGQAVTASVAWSPVNVRGETGLYVVADALHQVTESNETDNQAFHAFSAVGLPDLVLTIADVSLNPGYPRAGEAVSIGATVRNLGDRPSAATTLVVSEGEPDPAVVGTLAVPELAPGASAALVLPWTPGAPPGPRVLRLVVDPDGIVAEHDEGNNEVRLTVVVQDPDLYLTEPFFSPNGDGVKDDTTLAWRTAEPAQVVVADSRGRAVRTLAASGQSSASVTWDGRDDRSLVVPDGPYTLSLLGDQGRVLGRAEAVVDTDRTTLHSALLGRTTLRNLTCALAPALGEPAWMPAEDEVLYVVSFPQPGFPAGLLRAGLDGGFGYVAQDDWYRQAVVASPASVSPDGREVLLLANGGLAAVDLATGARRTVSASSASAAAWSPDGRFILVGTKVLARDGSAVGDLGPGQWVWSPGSDRLASVSTVGDSLVVVARDGTPVDAIPLNSNPGEEADWANPAGVVWRGDGQIVASVEFCIQPGSEPVCHGASFVVDPDARVARRLTFFASDPQRGLQGTWSPDGTRVILPSGELLLESGTSLGQLIPSLTAVSPRGTVALLRVGPSTTGPGALVCPGKYEDSLVLGGLTNLVIALQVAQLPGATGVVFKGTVGDLNLDHFQIDFADVSDPTTWHPIGTASDVPVVDDQIAVWVPPGPGQYVVRLTVADRAGNSRAVTRLVPWERAPALTSFTQSERLFSPNGDGVKDDVRIRYTALLPAHVDVRIVGPDPAGPGGPEGPEVFRSAVEHPDPGPQAFVWDGHDSSGRLVPDGWYTIRLNGLPFRVEIDNTPPEIGLELLGDPAAGAAPIGFTGAPYCVPNGITERPPFLPLSAVQARISVYVVDRNLTYWDAPWPTELSSREPVFVPDSDPSGAALLDAGRPRVSRQDGHPTGLVVPAFVGGSYPSSTSLRLEAHDLAGNVSVVTVEPPREAVVPLGATARCEALRESLTAEAPASVPPGPVNDLAPEKLYLQAGATPHQDSGAPARFELQPIDGGEWRPVGQPIGGGPLTTFRIDSFEALGLDPTEVFRGRFRLQGATEELVSPSFDFCPCKWRLEAELVYDRSLERFVVFVRGRLAAPLAGGHVNAHVQVGGSTTALPSLPLEPISADDVRRRLGLGLRDDEQALIGVLPPMTFDCSTQLGGNVLVQDEGGVTYPSGKVEPACQKLGFHYPEPTSCGSSGLSLAQTFEFWKATPGVLSVKEAGEAGEPAHVAIEGGLEAAPVLADAFDLPLRDRLSFDRTSPIAVGDASSGTYPVRGRITSAGTGKVLAEAEISAIVDRNAPTGEIVDPGEGRTVCLATGSGEPDLHTLVRFGDDKSESVATPRPFARFPGGDWMYLQATRCDGGPGCPTVLSTGPVHGLDVWAGPLDNGPYDLRLDFCDGSGNVGSTTRRVFVTRDPPRLQVRSLEPRAFSPNGDGVKESTLATVLMREPDILTARVHAGDATGPVVRTLFLEQPQATTEAGVLWDGRDDAGRRAADGPYAIVFTAADACGGKSEASASVDVDTVPPSVALTDPPPGQRLSASVDVQGQASDPHFADWQLDVACGSGPWTSLGTGSNRLDAPGFLARWDTSRAPAGECRLRLAAEDAAGNRSADVIVAVQVEKGDLLLRLAASPDVFSPNGDGRRDTTTLEYELSRTANVWLQVRDGAGHVLRSFEDGAERTGAWSLVWDGRNDAGQPVPEGDHVLWIRAEDPQVATVYEERTTRLVVDRTPPTIAIVRPAAGGFAPNTSWVHGSVADAHLADFTVTATPAGGTAVELVHAFQARTDADIAALGPLADGPHTLVVVATDLAENEARVEVPFVVDSTPPRASIQSPLNGAVLRRGETPIPVSGLVGDDHLDGWTLRFGSGSSPLAFVDLASGSAGGSGIPLAAWDVRQLPDGDYTLGLKATDRAGLATEARATVALDSRPPTVAIGAPAEGRYVTAPVAITGTAADAHLASWSLEAAPGSAATAYQWAPVADGKDPVESGTLGQWSPLPPDGVYTLRLTARDKVDLEAAARVTVTVDTTPPAAPAGLRSQVTKASEGYGSVRLTWNANAEPDLAGYRIWRDGVDLAGDSFPDPTRDDADRIEGRYVYAVAAVDRAGNVSPKATLTVRVDLTPPLVSFTSPAAGAAVAGSVEVRGTAYSADDFAEYRLYVGAGTEPVVWTLLRASSVPVAGGKLGDWLAVADGPYVLALEADDTSGNRARTTRPVVVDTRPPDPPVLVEVASPGTPPDRLVPRWDPSPSADVVGYLVQRNGRLANAPGIVLGDPRGLAVPGPTYVDDALPDGKHCYRIVAIDAAGNQSVPSNEICRPLDNRAPAALVVAPPDRTRFGYPVRVVAHAEDQDVARVLFEWSPAGAGQWHAFAEVDSMPDGPMPPWEVTLDPDAQHLAPGDYALRAVATDRASKTDPAPATITVTYGDTTPPARLEGLVARVDGADVALSWTPSTAADLASYRVYRDGDRVAEGLTSPVHSDPGLAPATYSYTVTAVDADGNESASSPSADAVVYALRLEDPAWPVVSGATGSVGGTGSRAGTTVRVLRADASVATAPASGGTFRVEGVPLVDDGNVLRARGEDGAGNRSIASNEVVLIADTPPAAVTDLFASVDGRGVALGWSTVGDGDLFGYVVSRDGRRLTATVAQKDASGLEASVAPETASLAFDENPATAWPPWETTGEWTVHFATPILVERLHLRFAAPTAANADSPLDYTVLALWQDRYVPIVKVRGGARPVADHPLPAPFATTAVRIALESPARIEEATIDRLDAVPAGTVEYHDEGVPDGRHTYEVVAIDRYGATGPTAAVEAGVGDVEPPGPPAGLVATPIGRDVQLAWSANTEPDLAGYVVLRDGSPIGRTPAPAFRDPGLPNGTYVYAVIAVDEAGLESAESAPATATVDVQPVPPPVPLILQPTDAADPLTLEATRTDVGGSSDRGTLVDLEVDGEARGSAPAEPGFDLVSSEALPGSPVALSPDGRLVAWAASGDTIGVRGQSSDDRTFAAGGLLRADSLVFSPDASRLAFARLSAAAPGLTEVVLMDLADGALRVALEGGPVSTAWSPDGNRLALSVIDSQAGGSVLDLLDVATGAVTELDRSSGIDAHLRWSPDGARLAFVRSWYGAAAELHLIERADRSETVLDEQPFAEAPPSWSPDGRRLAWTTAERAPLFVRIFDLDAGSVAAEVAEPGADVLDARFSPAGDWLSYVRVQPVAGGDPLGSLRAREGTTGLTLTVVEAQAAWTRPDAHEWLGDQLAIEALGVLQRFAPGGGRFVLRDVALRPGDNHLVARATDPSTGLTSADSATVTVTVSADAFPNLTVDADDIRSVPALPAVGHAAQVFVRVRNVGAADAGETDVSVRVTEPDGAVVLGTSVSLSGVRAGGSTWLALPWTPSVAGLHDVAVDVDPSGRVAETAEDDNHASRSVVVLAGEGIAAEISSDRPSYPAGAAASITVDVQNPGPPFEGVARTTVEELDGREIVSLDERPVSLDYGASVEFALGWTTGVTRAGRYAFRVRVRPTGQTAPAAVAETQFDVEPDLRVLAQVRPDPATVAEGAPVAFALSVGDQGTNAPLDGATARLRVQLEGSSDPPRFESVRPLPSVPPAGTWTDTDLWAPAGPPGRYAVVFEVEKATAILASATALVTVQAAAPDVRGSLSVEPAEVLAGQTPEAHVRVENRGTAAVSAFPIVVDVVSGPEATVRFSVLSTVDLGVGEARSLVLAIATDAIPPGRHVVRLRGGAGPLTLDRAGLVVHGLVAPPSPHAPEDGARVATAHPALVVNDASSPEGAALTYEFALYGDAALTQPMPGARGVPETPSRTSWTVLAGLAEDATYWWQARATDGFSTSPWSPVVSFTVDAVNRPPTGPVPDTPVPGSRVASRQPALAVRNAVDPEGQPLTYEFRLAADEAMSQLVAAQAGIGEGLGLTTWVPPVILDEDAVYYWSAQARTAGDAPEDFSPWSEPVSFRVDTVNGPPTAPQPLRPVGGATVKTHTPTLVARNATDPEGDPLTYRFEIDRRPTLDSPDRQVSPDRPPGATETAWTPPVELVENTHYYWRAIASDGTTETPSALATFFVNATDEAPSAPVPLDPVDGRTVGTATPALRLRNAVDPEDDPLTYEIEVREVTGAVVATAAGIPSGTTDTTWVATPPLGEDRAFAWSARANDGQLAGPWSAPAAFRVDAVAEPPTAPVPLLPADGAVVEERRPALVVGNAMSPDGLALTYAFELDAVAQDGSTTPVAQVDGVPESPSSTAWSPSADLEDGRYQWRARAADPRQPGPWSPTARFTVLVDAPPAAPKGLRATAGDARVRLDWTASPESDVTGYRVYRSTVAGGPHDFVGVATTPAFDDLGLVDGVTYYYVVTATDAHNESAPSAEAAARPETPPALVAEVRYDPSSIRAECLLPGRQTIRTISDRRLWSGLGMEGVAPSCQRPAICPDWLYATLELPAGHDPGAIDVESLRLFGSVAADARYSAIVDSDRDHLLERRVRFAIDAVAPHLAVGTNIAAVVGRVAGVEMRGEAAVEVLGLAVALRMTPRTLERRSRGQEVEAQLAFDDGVDAAAVDVGSIRLNGFVPVERVLCASRNELTVKFDRAATVGVLPLGSSVEVRVSGSLLGLDFVGVDHVRVIE